MGRGEEGWSREPTVKDAGPQGTGGDSPARMKPTELCVAELGGHLGQPSHRTDEITEAQESRHKLSVV